MKKPVDCLLKLFTLRYTYELLWASTNSIYFFFLKACRPGPWFDSFDWVRERASGLKTINLSAQICVGGVTDEWIVTKQREKNNQNVQWRGVEVFFLSSPVASDSFSIYAAYKLTSPAFILYSYILQIGKNRVIIMVKYIWYTIQLYFIY